MQDVPQTQKVGISHPVYLERVGPPDHEQDAILLHVLYYHVAGLQHASQGHLHQVESA